MTNRMDRYKTSKENKKSRSNKNQELYKTIYEESDYSNIEGIETIEQGNVINIDQIKEMLKKEASKKEKIFIEPIIKPEIEESQESYDINELIEKAKVKETFDNKKRSIDTSSYNYKRKGRKKDEDELELEKKNLDAGLFDDLKKTTEIDSNSIETNEQEEKEPEIDKSFYTSSIELTKDNIKKEEKQESSVLLVISIIVLSILLAFLIIYFINTLN